MVWGPGVRGNVERHTAVHGAALTAELGLFYATVLELFTRGNLGGWGCYWVCYWGVTRVLPGCYIAFQYSFI